MNSLLNWQDFLKQAGLPENTPCLTNPHQAFSLVRVTGTDAESFLHAQFSNSVTGLQAGDVRFAAWCNAKGRVWTLVRYWRHGDAILLRMPTDQVEATLKRLRMFVLRSNVVFETLDWHVVQFIGPGAELAAQQVVTQAGEDTFNIALPAAWALQEVWCASQLNCDLPRLPSDLEALPRIIAGIPEVFACQREEWIPQMLNLDKLNGIDLKKGCYPGQEIVAKLHYKGGLKQRLFIATVTGSQTANDQSKDVTDSDGRKAGMVVESALLGSQRWLAAVIRLDSAENELFLGALPITIR